MNGEVLNGMNTAGCTCTEQCAHCKVNGQVVNGMNTAGCTCTVYGQVVNRLNTAGCTCTEQCTHCKVNGQVVNGMNTVECRVPCSQEERSAVCYIDKNKVWALTCTRKYGQLCINKGLYTELTTNYLES